MHIKDVKYYHYCMHVLCIHVLSIIHVHVHVSVLHFLATYHYLLLHQVLRQFPLSFEFNDFYLRTLAYHLTSMRFHTFTLSCEKERCARNWLPYRPRPASIHGDQPHAEQYSCLWDYIEGLHSKSTMFYNFLYETSKSHVSRDIHTV